LVSGRNDASCTELTNELGEDVEGDLDSCDRGDNPNRYDQNKAQEDWMRREARGIEKRESARRRREETVLPSFCSTHFRRRCRRPRNWWGRR